MSIGNKTAGLLKGGIALAFILAVVLACGASRSYAASFSGGSGTEEDPYIITTAAQLDSIRSSQASLAAHYRLGNDIDLQQTYPVWTPIGTLATADRFRGSLDGNGYTISGMNIQSPDGQYLGLFASIHTTGKVFHLNLSHVDVAGYSYVGAVAGINRGMIEQVNITGKINGSARFIGGIVGRSTTADAYIGSSSFDGEIKGGSSVGGIAGENLNGATVEASGAKGTVRSEAADSTDVGGLVGVNSGYIRSSFAESAVTASGKNADNTGGLVGFNSYYMIDTFTSSNGTIQSSYATGAVVGRTTVGGLAGQNSGVIADSFAAGDVTSSYKSITGTVGFIGGFVGLNNGYGYSYNNGPYTYDGGFINNCYAVGNISAPNLKASTKGGFAGENEKHIENSFSLASEGSFAGTGGSAAPIDSRALQLSEMMLSETFPEWDFGQTWVIEEGETTPRLRSFLSPSAELNGLTINEGEIDTLFHPELLEYTAVVPYNTMEVNLQPVKQPFTELVIKKGQLLLPKTETGYRIILDQETTLIAIETRSPNGMNRLAYTVAITRDAAAAETYKVEFAANGGNPIESQTINQNGMAVMPPNPVREGYRFSGWYIDNDRFEQPYDFEGTPVTADIVLYAGWVKETSLGLTVTSAGGSVNGNQPTYAYGNTVRLIATPDEGYRFDSWNDGATGKLLSTQSAYSFTITGHTHLIARFSEVKPDIFTVRFISESGQILSVEQVQRGESATPPPPPSKPDTNFIGWSADYSNVQSDLTLRPIYSARVATYSLTVIGGSIPSGISEYPFDSAVTIIADNPAEGKQFSHWEADGRIISYNETYSFYITGHMTVAAVFAEAPVEQLPLVTISPDVIANSDSRKISFIGQIYMPPGYRLIECGLVVKQSDYPLTALYLGMEGSIRAKSSSQTSTGQFMMNKTGVNRGETWYANAYLIYQDSAGQVFTVYSSVVSGTIP